MKNLILDAKEYKRRRKEHLREEAEREAERSKELVGPQIEQINRALKESITSKLYSGDPVVRLTHKPHLYVKRELINAGWKMTYAGSYCPVKGKYDYVLREF